MSPKPSGYDQINFYSAQWIANMAPKIAVIKTLMMVVAVLCLFIEVTIDAQVNFSAFFLLLFLCLVGALLFIIFSVQE